jgi:ATP-dependent DNA ligase
MTGLPAGFPATVKPMLAKVEPELPRGAGWTYEPKWDGFRCLVFRDGDGVRLQSRDERPLGRYLPELVEVLGAAEGAPYVADGEAVIVRPHGLGFDELLQRIHPAASRVAMLAERWPATLILFDLLADSEQDLREEPLSARRARLETVAASIGAPPAPQDLERLRPGPGVLLTPWTDDPAVAERWFADEAGIGQDGVLAKREDLPYRPGERAMVKVKHRRSADCVVGGYRLGKDGTGVGSLLLGLYADDGILHYVGHTSSFRARERRELLAALAPLEGGHSLEGGCAPGGPSRWSANRDLSWVALTPSLVCEVSFDRLQSGRFRHAATFVRWREDRDPRSCTFDQLGALPPSWPDPSA